MSLNTHTTYRHTQKVASHYALSWATATQLGRINCTLTDLLQITAAASVACVCVSVWHWPPLSNTYDKVQRCWHVWVQRTRGHRQRWGIILYTSIFILRLVSAGSRGIYCTDFISRSWETDCADLWCSYQIMPQLHVWPLLFTCEQVTQTIGWFFCSLVLWMAREGQVSSQDVFSL